MFNSTLFNQFIIDNHVIGIHDNPITLKSGKKSHLYINWRHISNNSLLLEQSAHFVINFCNHHNLTPDCFYGVPEGATKLGILTQYIFNKTYANNQQLCMGRAKPKEHGSPTDKFFIGEPTGKIIILEDVITTGQSLFNTVDQLQALNKDILACISLTNREPNSTKNVVENQLKQRNIKYYTLSDAKTLLTQLKNQTPEKSKLINLELNQL